MNKEPETPATDILPEQQTPAPAPQSETTTVQNSTEPRSFLVAFLLAMNFGILGLRNFYLGDKKTGWIRVGFLIGYVLVGVIASLTGQAALMVVAFALMSAALIWTLVDFFYVYFTVKTDATGHPLAASARDKKWAKGLFWTTITFAVLYVAVVVALIAVGQNQMQKDTNFWRDIESDTQVDSDYNFN